jgi:hypothetical protein
MRRQRAVAIERITRGNDAILRPSLHRSAVSKVVGAKNAKSVVTVGFILVW